jgi:hypothetical protein
MTSSEGVQARKVLLITKINRLQRGMRSEKPLARAFLGKVDISKPKDGAAMAAVA